MAISTNGIEVTQYIRHVLTPTPSGVEKILALWDGLEIIEQISIIECLSDFRLPAYLSDKIRFKAFESQNSYMRYLAARGLYISSGDSEERQLFRKKVLEDGSELVKNAFLEEEYALGLGAEYKDPEGFFSMAHEKRLAKIRGLNGNCVEPFASLIEYAVTSLLPNCKIIEIEIYELLADYLKNPSFKKKFQQERGYDGYGEYLKGRGLERLWGLTRIVPEGLSLIIIENLPTHGGFCDAIPQSVLDGFSDKQKFTLLYRDDVALIDYRRKLVLSDNTGDDVKNAALSCNFDLEYEEFHVILNKEKKQQATELKRLTDWARDLSLVIYEAIHDRFCVLGSSPMGLDYEYASDAKNMFDFRFGKLTNAQKLTQVRELRLYRLAKDVVPWQNGDEPTQLEGDFEFLNQYIVKGDTWETFMNFSKNWLTLKGLPINEYPQGRRILERRLEEFCPIEN